MVKVGLFHTAGHAELGGLQRLLERIAPNVRFERCFPARKTRGPKPGVASRTEALAEPTAGQLGKTGGRLVSEMMKIIEGHHGHDGDYQAYLLVDDADCRYCPDGEERYRRWIDDLNVRVRAARQGQAVPLFVILAHQELESWLLADWERSFAMEFSDAHALRARLAARLEIEDWRVIEELGCPLDRARETCTVKVSVEIERAMEEMSAASVVSERFVRYSKGTHGSAMLRRVEPDRIAATCTRFRQDIARLRTGLAGLHR